MAADFLMNYDAVADQAAAKTFCVTLEKALNDAGLGNVAEVCTTAV